MTGRPIKPKLPTAEVRHNDDMVTFAVTFKWRKPWAMDHCEVAVIAGEMRRALITHFAGYEQLDQLVAVETWEPYEERHIGRLVTSCPLHGGVS